MNKKRKFLKRFVVILALIATGCATDPMPVADNNAKGTPEKGPAFDSYDTARYEAALRAPAGDLARGYDYLTSMMIKLPFVEMGLTIHTPEGTIRKDNYKEVKTEFERRLVSYEAAINERGYKNINGAYHATAASCWKHIQSYWIGMIGAGKVDEIKISQDGFKVQLDSRYQSEGKPNPRGIPGIVVESVLTFVDPLNSDLVLLGTIKPGEIIVRPDLSQCTVTLIPTQE